VLALVPTTQIMRCRNPASSLAETVLPKRMVDLVRLEDGSLVEHWDVIRDKMARETSKTGLPTFRDKFPD
jgi:predicted SnoaL-like aldol condensation-catalyzing enzyme